MNVLRALQHAGAGIVHNLDQQPWNRTRFRRVSLLQHLPFHLAAIIQLPRWAGIVRAHHFALSIEQLSQRPLERPSQLAVMVTLAYIDLVTPGLDLQQLYLPVRDFKFFWNRRHSFSLNTGGDSNILKSHPFCSYRMLCGTTANMKSSKKLLKLADDFRIN